MQRSERLFRKALKYQNKGENNKALEKYKKYLDIDHEYKNAYYGGRLTLRNKEGILDNFVKSICIAILLILFSGVVSVKAEQQTFALLHAMVEQRQPTAEFNQDEIEAKNNSFFPKINNTSTTRFESIFGRCTLLQQTFDAIVSPFWIKRILLLLFIFFTFPLTTYFSSTLWAFCE